MCLSEWLQYFSYTPICIWQKNTYFSYETVQIFQKSICIQVTYLQNMYSSFMLWIIDSWQLKQILKLYIYFIVFNTTSSVKLFEVTVSFLSPFSKDLREHFYVEGRISPKKLRAIPILKINNLWMIIIFCSALLEDL